MLSLATNAVHDQAVLVREPQHSQRQRDKGRLPGRAFVEVVPLGARGHSSEQDVCIMQVLLQEPVTCPSDARQQAKEAL